MKTLFLASVCCLALLPAFPDNSSEPETVRKNFPVTGAAKLEVDNIWGSIDVHAYPGREIRLVARRTLLTDDPEARREVKLDLTQSGNTVRAYVDGPFRCHCDNRWNGNRDDRVQYDFQVEVPVHTALALSTVTSGEIVVRGTAGPFEIHNVNGRIEMSGVAGSGQVSTVNGEIRAVFSQNPEAPLSFRTVNGDVDVTFQPRLSADVKVKTMHGDVFTDFGVSPLPQVVSAPERRNGRFIYRSSDSSQFRIGAGGPELRLETLNGTIRIRSQK